MKKIAVLLLSVFVFVLAAGTVLAEEQTPEKQREEQEEQKKEKKIFFLSPTLGYFLPSSGKTRDAFGSSWGGFSVSVNPEAFGWKSPQVKAGGMELTPYIGFTRAKRGDNKAYIIPVGVATSWKLKEGKNYATSLSLALSANGVRVKVPDEGINSDWKVAAGARLTLGYSLAKWLELTAGYSFMTKVEGYDFNGFSVGAKINFYF